MMPSPRTDDAALDEALADTFPASDPPSQTVPVAATWMEAPPHAAAQLVLAYRVTSRDEAATAFARQPHYDAGRWSSAGTAAVYASLSVAGALLEALAHMDGATPDDRVLAVASLPAECLHDAADVPPSWRELPYREEVQRFGDAWLAAQAALALKVPSATCEREFNLVLNPEHPDLARVQVTELVPLTIDKRLRG